MLKKQGQLWVHIPGIDKTFYGAYGDLGEIKEHLEHAYRQVAANQLIFFDFEDSSGNTHYMSPESFIASHFWIKESRG